ncbi:MAG: patatin-like phospholipase family protein [Acidobacteria bacterium]|nr:patatin-like phospholipase family protein [Acidobacteriota bacterium]
MRALVLSAGGAFGAYQAGAWRSLEERGFQPELVVGTSIGAVNATVVARGCTGQRLERWWRDPRSNVFRWSRGLLDAASLASRLDELCREFPASAAKARLLVTLTELPGTRIRAVHDEQVTPRHLLASCAVPLFYRPVKLDGRWYGDGGVFCRLPLAAAVEAGATEIVAVDLLAAPPSLVARGLLNAVSRVRRFLLAEPDLMQVPDRVRLWRVEPRRPLGKPWDMLRWNPASIDRWIEQGYRDAAALRANQASAAQPSNPSAERAAPR